MSSEDDLGIQLQRTLEAHEATIKRTLETLGTVERRLAAVANATEDDEQASLETLGKALERHEESLEDVVQSLDEHKRVVRQADGVGQRALEEAMEKARRQARQEPTPPGAPNDDTSDK